MRMRELVVQIQDGADEDKSALAELRALYYPVRPPPGERSFIYVGLRDPDLRDSRGRSQFEDALVGLMEIADAW
jgi:hypothetical protein